MVNSNVFRDISYRAVTNKLNGITTSYVMIFDADKTGLEYEIKPNGNLIKYDFYWDQDEENNYIIKYIDDNRSKNTYNSEMIHS